MFYYSDEWIFRSTKLGVRTLSGQIEIYTEINSKTNVADRTIAFEVDKTVLKIKNESIWHE